MQKAKTLGVGSKQREDQLAEAMHAIKMATTRKSQNIEEARLKDQAAAAERRCVRYITAADSLRSHAYWLV